MDYPKSVPGVGLVDGRFVDENPATGQIGSLIPAAWGNAVTGELLNVIVAAGLIPSEAEQDQLLRAINQLIAVQLPTQRVIALTDDAVLTTEQMGLVLIDATSGARTITLPAADAALGVVDIIVRRLDNSGNRLKVQASGADKIKFHTHLAPAGYGFFYLMGAGDWWHLRSDGAGGWWPVGRADTTPLGRPVFDTTTAFPPGGYGALSGAVLNRADWPWLWDHAQQSGMLTTEAARVGMEGGWTSGDGALTFRGPDGRGEFLRLSDESRGVDPGRIAGSRQADDLKSHVHSNGFISQVQAGSGGSYWAGANISNTGAAGGTETRPKNIAYPGRIKLI